MAGALQYLREFKMQEDTKTAILERLNALLEAGDKSAIGELVSELHHSDIAWLINNIEDTERIEVFKLLPAETTSEVILELDEAIREKLLSAISKEELVEMVDEMNTDDATDLIAELPIDEAKTVLEGIEREDSIEVQKLLHYPEDTAGGKMQTELVAVPEDATVEETIEHVRSMSDKVDNLSNVFVVDDGGRLAGIVPLDKLILAKPHIPAKDIMNKKFIRVTVNEDQEEVARIFQKYDLLSMAVVDKDGKVVGRITVDDVVDVIEDEIFEDFYKMAGLNTDERVLDSPSRSIRMRIPWLIVNLGTAFLAASVVRFFADTIQTLVMLAVFMPVVAGMGGNAATQTITVVVRGLALGELELRHAKRILLKEITVGLVNGGLLGLAAALIAYLFGINYTIGILLFLAMTANLIIAGLAGSLIPLVLKWFKADPALSASVFATACTDIGGFFSFLGLAALFMRHGLL
ncbi:MAG: magnesium transporter [Thermodesulfobacteriota bacterium]